MKRIFSILTTCLLLIPLNLAAQSSITDDKNSNVTESDLPKVSDDSKKTDDGTLKESKLLTKSLSDTIDFSSKKIESLMMKEEESTNVSKAIEAFRSGQPFVPSINGESVTGYTSDQLAAAQKALEDQMGEENEKSYIYLASIMYFTPKDWAVWINDKKITPENNKVKNDLYLKSIKQDSVDVRWKLSISKWKILAGETDESKAPNVNESSEVVVKFTLKPNQTYMLSNGQVVEGKAVVALIRKKEADEKNKKK